MLAARLALVPLLGFAICVGASAQALPPAEAFGDLPAISAPRLSPDGRHFSLIQPLDGRPALAIYTVNAAAGERPAVVTDTLGTIFNAGWGKNDRLIVYDKLNTKAVWDERLREWTRAYSVDLSGGAPVVLMNDSIFLNINVTTTHVVDLDLDDPDSIFMEMIGGSAINLYRVNIRTGLSHTEAAPQDTSNFTAGWLTDGHGHMLGRLASVSGRKNYSLVLFQKGRWSGSLHYAEADDDNADVEGLLPDGGAFVVKRTAENGQIVLSRFDVPENMLGATLFSDPHYDVGGTLLDDWTNRVIGGWHIEDTIHYDYFDPAWQSLQRSLEAAFPGQSVAIASADQPAAHLIVEASSPRQPPRIFYFDRATLHATIIGLAYPQVPLDGLGDMKPYPYKARDGLDIPAYLTLPPRREAKNLPLIVMPHGGPNARDYVRFDWWAQFLVSRGYAVFQPNYRGSTGYGTKFTAAGDLQWGHKMQDDITDGVQKLIADGIADPKRICIVGASYGGYAALAGAAFTPDLYACAVSFAGVSDLHAFELWQEKRYGKYGPFKNFEQHVAAGTGAADAVSPALHAGQIHIPVLLMHAAGDITVPIEQSEEMRDALKKAGKDVSYVALDGDDHYFSLAATRIRMLQETERFLAAHLGK